MLHEVIGTEFTEVQISDPIVVDYPAAPAVAAAILRDAGIEHRYDTGITEGKGKKLQTIYGNYISEVAHMMGSHVGDENGSWFMGIDKRDYEAYADAVYEYL